MFFDLILIFYCYYLDPTFVILCNINFLALFIQNIIWNVAYFIVVFKIANWGYI